MTHETDTTATSTTATEGDATAPPRLQGAQRRLADAYQDADAGLFVLNCVPGSGKSFVRTDLAAKELLRRWVNGDQTPEQHICVMTFTREEAASITTEIIDRLETLVAHDRTPAASAVSEAAVDRLRRRIRQAPYIGTIDSVLRTLFLDIAVDVGFADEPNIGNDVLLKRIHRDCYDALGSKPECTAALERLQGAYPSGEYDDGVDTLLRDSLRYCRSHQLTIEEFESRLTASVAAVYADGELTSSADLVTALARYVSDDEAQSALAAVETETRQALVKGDRELYQAWHARIDDFVTALEAYTIEYENRIREAGVVSHLDCAYLVATYFGTAQTNQGDGDGDDDDNDNGNDDDSDAIRTRAFDRHHTRIESWIIDEAQDLSAIQHAALAPFVSAADRVVAAGDLRQSIYTWRDAHPDLFARAISDGTYFGVDWPRHVVETATRTYRCRPDIAAAINAIAEPALTDPVRGNIGDLDIEYPTLEPVRNPTPEPSLHVAGFRARGTPGSAPYVAPESNKGEADILATYIACGLADGTLTPTASGADTAADGSNGTAQEDRHPDEATPAVTVLFRRRCHMDRYAAAFEAQGLSVRSATEPLFDCPAVTAVVDVIDWLVDPFDTDRTKSLLRDSVFDVTSQEALCSRQHWDLDAVLASDGATEMNTQQRALLKGLREIRDSQGIQHTSTAPDLADAIIDSLQLRADAYEMLASTQSAQRVANLDAFTSWLADVQTADTMTPERIIELVEPFREDPQDGPTQAVTSTQTADVAFKTIHQMKGDEAPIIALADLGFDLWFPGPANNRFIDAGDVAALAPPETGDIPPVGGLSVFSGGIYAPATAPSQTDGTLSATDASARDRGLRWATEHWLRDGQGDSTLVGPSRLQTVARNARAEEWRLLYVALTRARDHLVFPLSEMHDEDRRPDRWLETIQAGLEYDGSVPAGTHTIDGPVGDDTRRSVSVSVNNVSLDAHRSHQVPTDERSATREAEAVPVQDTALDAFVPRILRPSTLEPLIEAPQEVVLEHLQNKPLDTAADAVDAELPFRSEAIEPAEVGAVCHDIFATVITQVTAGSGAVRDASELWTIVEPIIDKQSGTLPAETRGNLTTFLSACVVPQLVDSDCWTRILNADRVYTEKSLAGKIRLNDVAFEFDGTSDVVLKQSDGSWEIIDLKIALGSLLSETETRYRLQTLAYRQLLQQEVTEPIRCSLEVFGAERSTISSTGSSADVLERLEDLS